EDGPTSPDVHFEPIVKLAPVEIKTLEENEEEVFRIRAKLFRYFKNGETTEWKERGVGDIKILKSNNDASKYRIVMRRDKTFKLCANHYLLPTMELKANCDSDRAFVWNTPADFADEEPKAETLAIRFANAESKYTL
ncbi:ran-specific GTPase-activating protein-like, partial [Anneissia japonica]|uniref:ran-specific GTPase-activating protein-like n=1 Tax=Anneissia japonica TaxID=1529436 RepID=UPI0014258577